MLFAEERYKMKEKGNHTMLEKIFKLSQHNTDVKTEVLADAGMDPTAVLLYILPVLFILKYILM